MSDRPFRLTGLLLAAGHSRRFGSDKRRHRLPDGRSLLQASAEGLASVCEQVLIGVRHDDTDLSDCLGLREGWQLIHVDADNAGMGDTLATLAREVLRQGNATGQLPDAVMVALGDMPFIRPDTWAYIARSAFFRFCHAAHTTCAGSVDGTGNTSAQALVPLHAQRRGHPVVFQSGLLAELENCSGDLGARHVLTSAHCNLHLLPCDDPAVLVDIDERD